MISQQLLRFGVVGVSAMGVHMATAIGLVTAGMLPLAANVIAFLVAFQVSYLGHRLWTFEAHALPHRDTLPRFFGVALMSFAVNEGMYFLLLRYAPLPYWLSLGIVLVAVAAGTFVCSRYWAFRQPQ